MNISVRFTMQQKQCKEARSWESGQKGEKMHSQSMQKWKINYVYIQLLFCIFYSNQEK